MAGTRMRREGWGPRVYVLRMLAVVASILFLGIAVPPARGQVPDEEPNADEFQDAHADTTVAPEDQKEGGETLGGIVGRARADTTANAGMLTVLHPIYVTSYDVARQTTNWNQDFKFGSKVGFFNFDNATKFNIRTDSGRNETRRDGSNLTNLRMLKIPLNATVNLRRSSVERPTTDRQPGEHRQNDDVGLNVSSRDIRRKLLDITHRVSFGGGLSYRSSQTELSSKRSQSFDSGLEANASWKGTWDPLKILSLDGDAKWSRIQKESRLEQDTTKVSQPTADVNRSFGLQARVDPSPWITTTLDLSTALSDDETYNTVPTTPGQPPSQRLEHQVTNNKSISAQFGLLRNIKGLDLSFNLAKSTQELDYRLRRDFAYTGNTSSWNGHVKTDLLGNTIDATLSGDTDVLNRATSVGTDTRTNIFEGKVSRKINKKLQARFNWMARAKQVFFEDESLDQDELQIKLQPSLSYTPNQKWSVNAAFFRKTSRRAEINPRQALQSREEENYNVDVQITCHLSGSTDLTQMYSITALYTTFDYNQSRDRLVSTQRITTGLTTRVGPRCEFTVDHRFVLADSGPFQFDANGARVFARDLRSYTQEMNTNLTYRLTSWLSARVNSQFVRTDNVNEYLGRRTTIRSLNLQTGVDVQKTLQGSVKVRGSGQYVQSNERDPYWFLQSGLTKDF